MVVTIVSRCEMAKRGHRHLAEDLSQRLPRFFHDILFVEWTLDEEGQNKIVHCNMHAKKGFYRITANADSFAHAMHLALEKLVEQRRREKAHRVRRRRSENTSEVTTPV